MTRFLLAGTRPPPEFAGGSGELALAAAAHRLAATAAWYGWLRRWAQGVPAGVGRTQGALRFQTVRGNTGLI